MGIKFQNWPKGYIKLCEMRKIHIIKREMMTMNMKEIEMKTNEKEKAILIKLYTYLWTISEGRGYWEWIYQSETSRVWSEHCGIHRFAYLVRSDEEFWKNVMVETYERTARLTWGKYVERTDQKTITANWVFDIKWN